jgi:hypothetical protein
MKTIELKAIMAAILVNSLKNDYINNLNAAVITAVDLANMILEEVTKDENETLAEYKRFKESQLPPWAKSPMPTDK